MSTERTMWLGADLLTVDQCHELIKAAEAGIYRDDVIRETWRAEAWSLSADRLSAQVRPTVDTLLSVVAAANSEFWPRLACHYYDVELKRYTTGHRHPPHRDSGTPDRCQIQASVQLSAPHGYSGGDLLIDTPTGQIAALRDQGAMAIFPADVVHQVTEITRGHRWALIVTGMEVVLENLSVYLHGSVARGDDRPDSDIDVLVVGRGASALTDRQLDGLLETAGIPALADGRHIDVTTGGTASLPDNPIHVMCLRSGRHLLGPKLDPPLPDRDDYIAAVEEFAQTLRARGEHTDAQSWERTVERAGRGEPLDTIARTHPLDASVNR